MSSNYRISKASIYESFYGIAKKLSAGRREKFLMDILAYQFEGIEPTFESIEDEMIWMAILPNIENALENQINGEKGGRPKKNMLTNKKTPLSENENPPFLNKKTPLSENENPPFLTNDNDNDNVNEKVNDNDNVLSLNSESEQKVPENFSFVKRESDKKLFYHPDNVINPYHEVYFETYENFCPDLPKLMFERKNKDVKQALNDFIVEIDNDIGYFQDVCKKANEQKTIVNAKIDFKTLIKNHSKIYNEACLTDEQRLKIKREKEERELQEWVERSKQNEPERISDKTDTVFSAGREYSDTGTG